MDTTSLTLPDPPYPCPKGGEPYSLEAMAFLLRQSPRFARFIRSQAIKAIRDNDAGALACLRSYYFPQQDERELLGLVLVTEDGVDKPRCTEHAALVLALTSDL
jgi:hypothetical protein